MKAEAKAEAEATAEAEAEAKAKAKANVIHLPQSVVEFWPFIDGLCICRHALHCAVARFGARYHGCPVIRPRYVRF